MYVGWLVGIFGTAFHYLFFEKIYMCMYVGNNYTGHVHLPMKHVLISTHVCTTQYSDPKVITKGTL